MVMKRQECRRQERRLNRTSRYAPGGGGGDGTLAAGAKFSGVSSSLGSRMAPSGWLNDCQ